MDEQVKEEDDGPVVNGLCTFLSMSSNRLVKVRMYSLAKRSVSILVILNSDLGRRSLLHELVEAEEDMSSSSR